MLRQMIVVILSAALISISQVPAKAAEEELVVWMWTAHVTDLYQGWYKKITQWFEEENPGATIRFEFVDTASGEKLVSAVAGGSPPDVSLASIAHARTFYEAGMFMDLNHYVDATPHMALDNFLPASVLFGQKDGRIFGLPWSLEARAVLYNRRHMIEAGLDERPYALETWDDLVRYAQALVRRDGDRNITRSGMVLGRDVSNFAAYLYSNGGSFYNADGTAVAFNDSKGIETLEMMVRFANEYDVTQPGAGWLNLLNETASMVIGDTSSISRFQAEAPDFVDWLDMAPIPRGPQGTRSSTVSWSNMFVIPRGASKPDLGWRFIQLWLSPRVQEEFFVHFGAMSVRSARRDFFQTDAFHRSMLDVPYMAIAPEIFTYAGPYPYIRFTDINRQIAPLLTQAQSGAIAASAALAEAERIANSILQQ